MRPLRDALSGPLLFLAAVLLFLLLSEAAARFLVVEEAVSIVRVRPQARGFLQRDIRRGSINGVILYHYPFERMYGRGRGNNTLRIIILGDSMTEGGGLPEKEERRFAAVLQHLLNNLSASHGGSREYEILVFAEPGYNIWQIEELFYEALEFEPDIILYNFFINDLDLMRIKRSSGGDREIESYSREVHYPAGIPGNEILLEHSHAYWFLANRLSTILEKRDPSFRPYTNNYNPDWLPAQDALHRMTDAAGSARLPFIIMLSPRLDRPEIIGSHDPSDFIVSSCRSGVQIWDISEALAKSYAPEELRLSATDDHPNALGHAAIAEALQHYFERYALDRLGHLVPADDEGVPCTVV